MILLNRTLQEETKNRLEKGKEIKAYTEKLSSELTKKMETLIHINTRNINKRINKVKNYHSENFFWGDQLAQNKFLGPRPLAEGLFSLLRKSLDSHLDSG